MSDKIYSEKDLYNNCVTDLKRSAIAFFQNPQGKAHQIFLRHALKILGQIRGKKAQDIAVQIFKLEKITAAKPQNREEVVNLADKMLTFGSLLRR